MCRQQVRKRRLPALLERPKRLEGAGDPARRLRNPLVLRGLGSIQKPVQPVAGARAAQQLSFQPANGVPETHRLHAAGRKRVLERGEQFGGGEILRRRMGDEPQERAHGRPAERCAGAVVGH